MTNKKLFSVMKNEIKTEIPDIWDGIKDAPINECKPEKQYKQNSHKFIPVLASASIAAVALAVTLCIYISHNNQQSAPGLVQEKTDAPSYSAPASETTYTQTGEGGIPAWYLPQKIKATTVTYAPVNTAVSLKKKVSVSPLGSLTTKYQNAKGINTPAENIVAALPESTRILQGLNARFLDISGEYNSPEHSNCTGLYFDTKTGEVICYTHKVRKLLGLSDNAYIIFNCTDNSDYILFFADETEKSYMLNKATGEYKVMPDILTGAQMMINATDDFSSLVFIKDAENPAFAVALFDVFVLDTASGEYKKISAGFNATDSFKLSKNGKFAAFAIFNDDGTRPDHTADRWILYSLADSKIIKITKPGELLSFINDDSAAILRDDNGYFAVDTSTGEEIALSSQSSDYTCKYIYDKSDSDGYKSFVYCADVSDNTEKAVTSASVNAYAKSEDNRYIYTYTSGEQFVKCINSATLESFEISVDKSFVEKINEYDSDDRVIFNLYISHDMTSLLLCYTAYKDKNAEKLPEYSGWDVREHSASETAEFFGSIRLVSPYSPQAEGFSGGTLFIDNSNENAYNTVIKIIDIIKSQQYSLIGASDYEEKELVFGIDAVKEGGVYMNINVYKTETDLYCIEYNNISGVAYISAETYGSLCELFNLLKSMGLENAPESFNIVTTAPAG